MRPAFHIDDLPIPEPIENFIYDDTTAGMEIDEVKFPLHQI